MIKSRLNINGTDLGFFSELPISTNMSIADVREPEKRNGSYSKTITIPLNGDAKRLFEYIFQVNSTLTSFNPNIKTPAKYFVNEVLVFDGSLQLLKINNTFINDYASSEAECSLIGNSGNLFLDIAGLYLTDIDFSDLDHTFDFTGTMFAPAVLGTGYAYGYIDYGTNALGTRLQDVWAFRYLKPAIFEREYVSRIFSDAGYSWETGGYFDSDYEKRILIPDVNEGKAKISDANRLDNECYIGITPDYENGVKTELAADLSAWRFYGNEYINFVIPYNNEAAPYSDPNGRWDSGTNWEFTVNQESDYYLYGSIVLKLNLIAAPAGSVSWANAVSEGYGVKLNIEKSTDGGSTWGIINSQIFTFTWNELIAVDVITTNISVTTPSHTLYSGDLVRISLQQQQVLNSVSVNGISFRDAGNFDIYVGTASIRIDIGEGSEFNARMASPDIGEGMTLDMNTTVPQNITQLDFLTSIIKSENLYLELSKSVKDQYIIEAREDFIEYTNALDWTDKWDISRKQEIVPMGELDWNRLIFKYKTDKDHYNTVYENTYKEVYGTEKRDVENEFIKKDKLVEVVFSATPIAGNNLNDIVCPRFLNLDVATGLVKPLKVNIRRLYWGGLITCQDHTFIYNSTVTTRTTYPFIGHLDHPKTPTIDLSFDNPQELYWFFPGRTYTDNNRFNERYSKFVTEITDPNSKIVRMWLNLNETDINRFSFRKLVFIRDSYYLVNKIIDYNPQVKSVTQVEFLKLKAGSVFVPNNNIEEIDLGGEPTDRNYLGNYNNGSGQILGTNNINYGFGSVIVGDGNIVG